jgi:hypothetical protein
MYAQTFERSLLENASRGNFDFDAMKKALDDAVLEHLTGKKPQDSVELLDLAPSVQRFLPAIHDQIEQHGILAHKLVGEAVARFWSNETEFLRFPERSRGLMGEALAVKLAEIARKDPESLPFACLFASRSVAWGEKLGGPRIRTL